MQHQVSKIKVYCTENYNLFKKVDGNRGLNTKKIERIISEIESGNDVLDLHPVVVKENKTSLEVLDGQHRIEVAKRLKRQVHYVLKKEAMNLYQVAKVNSNVEKWKADDFIKCYIAAGNNNYKQLEKFHQTYNISVGVCLTMLDQGIINNDQGATANLYRDFETGVFVVKKYKEAVQLVEICKSFEAFEGWNHRSFILAISKIISSDKCEMDVLLKKFKADPRLLQKQSDWRKYLTNLEEIYNIGNHKRRVIF